MLPTLTSNHTRAQKREEPEERHHGGGRAHTGRRKHSVMRAVTYCVQQSLPLRQHDRQHFPHGTQHQMQRPQHNWRRHAFQSHLKKLTMTFTKHHTRTMPATPPMTINTISTVSILALCRVRSDDPISYEQSVADSRTPQVVWCSSDGATFDAAAANGCASLSTIRRQGR